MASFIKPVFFIRICRNATNGILQSSQPLHLSSIKYGYYSAVLTWRFPWDMTSSWVEPWINELLFIHFFSWRAELKEEKMSGKKTELLFLFSSVSFDILSLAVSWRIFIAATPCWFLNVNSSSAAVPDLRVQLLCRLRVSHLTQISER